MSESHEAYMFSSSWLETDKYLEILNNIDISRTISKPPAKPCPGSILIYINTKYEEDWRCDQYRWRNKGYALIPKREPKLKCVYFDCYKGTGFSKRAYTLYPNKNGTLIHYNGTIENVIHECHGNRKKNQGILHVTTTKEQLFAQTQFMDKTPNIAYKKLALQDIPAPLIPVLLPKNKKQVINTITRERQRKLLSSDDIYGLYLIETEFSGYIKKLELLPDFFAIVVSQEMITLYKKVCNLKRSILYYDTTFNLGDFFLSPLTFQNASFKSKPVIPLAYLIHHSKKKEIHSQFFQNMLYLIPDLVGKIFVTDREAAIVHAIKKIFPENPHVFCWNHILQDVKNWVKNRKNTGKDDIQAYCSHIWDLLDSDSEEVFNNKLSDMSEHWSLQFRVYFDTSLKPPIMRSGKWILTKMDIYTQRSGITINPDESFNAVLKRVMEHREVKLQVMVLCLYQIDKYYIKEILKGYSKLSSDYILDEKLEELYFVRADEVKWPKSSVSLDHLPYVFQNKDKELIKDEETVHTNLNIAKTMLLEGRVKLVPESQAFIISGETAHHVVTLFPDETCSCKVKRHCHHIKAAQLAIGNFQPKQKKIKLSTVMRKERGYKAGRKNYPRNIKIVEAADDAEATINEEMATSLLIPTISKKQVKHRFLVTPETSRTRAFNKNASNICTSTPDERIAVSSPKKLELSPTNECELSPTPPSTPLSTKKNELQIRDERCEIDSFNSLDEDFNFTFNYNFKNNKQFLIGGRQIKPSDLNTVWPLLDNKEESYFIDSIFDVYLMILIHYRRTKLSVQLFAMESYITNSICSMEGSFLNTVQYFIEHNVPEYDIVLAPLVKHAHCRLIIFLRKQKIIIYLDSINNENVPLEEISYFLGAYHQFHKSKSEDFDMREWKLYCPPDIPKQSNSYDCGAYVCLYAELLIEGQEEVMRFHYNNDMEKYRQKIRNDIEREMLKNNIVSVKKNVCSKKMLKYIRQPSVDIEIFFEAIDNLPTVTYLKDIVNEYWDENTLSTCYLGTSCENVGEKMVLCAKCSHWYHKACMGMKGGTPKKFKCSKCMV